MKSIDLVVANAENAAGGIGVDIKSAKDLLSAGVHVLTSGNHIWKKKEIYSFLDEHEKLIRPANYPAGAPGRGWCLWRQNDLKALVINIQGRVFMPNHVDDPFRCVDDILKEQGTEFASDYRRYACRSDIGKDCHGLVSRRPRLDCFWHAHSCADGR